MPIGLKQNEKGDESATGNNQDKMVLTVMMVMMMKGQSMQPCTDKSRAGTASQGFSIGTIHIQYAILHNFKELSPFGHHLGHLKNQSN